MTDYRMFDTKRADGCYVKFERILHDDNDASPDDYLFQDEDYRDEDQARLDAFNNGEWGFIGIQAIAHVAIVRSGTGVMHTLTSPGLWGVESDSDEAYLAECYENEKVQLLSDMKAMGTPTIVTL